MVCSASIAQRIAPKEGLEAENYHAAQCLSVIALHESCMGRSRQFGIDVFWRDLLVCRPDEFSVIRRNQGVGIDN